MTTNKILAALGYYNFQKKKKQINKVKEVLSLPRPGFLNYIFEVPCD